MSVCGSAVVFRREIAKAIYPRTVTVAQLGTRLSDARLAEIAGEQFKRFHADSISVRKARQPDIAVEVWLLAGNNRIERLFNPYTGKSLGDTVEKEPRFMSWLVSFHDELALDDTGKLINGIGAIALALLCLSGAVIWWPGKARWRTSLFLSAQKEWRRTLWNLHSVFGFWMFLLLLMWALTGIYLAFPEPFSGQSQLIEDTVEWLVRAHFGRTFGLTVKILWVILGLIPAAMFVTGALMWWYRVARPALARNRTRMSQARLDNVK
jgi:uncharacterized iron-regulated membrane protein